MADRTILHIDMNNFYASVECSRHPELKQYPIAVCGDPEERHGIVLAKNYLAKARGVSTGEAIWQAKQKCRDLVIVYPHYGEYMKYSRMARDIYSRYTDQIEPFGMDEVWADMTGSARLFGSGEQIAEEIRSAVKEELGLTVSIGVSFNKIFAKLGSDMKKPDAVTVIPRESFRQIIYGLPASDLLGVGRATERELAKCGILTIGDIARWPEDFFRRRFGKRGAELWQAACGEDHSPVVVRSTEAPDKTAGHGMTGLKDLENNEEVWLFLLELSQEIGHRLRVFRKQASGVEVFVRSSRLIWEEWQCPLKKPTQSPLELARAGYALFLQRYRWNDPIRSVTIRATGLESVDTPHQIGFFEDTEADARADAIDGAVDRIREKYGSGAIRNASLLMNSKFPAHDGPDIPALPRAAV